MANIDEKLARIDRLDAKLSESIITIQMFDFRVTSLEKAVASMQEHASQTMVAFERLLDTVEKTALSLDQLFPVIDNIQKRLEQQKLSIDRLAEKSPVIENVKSTLESHIANTALIEKKQSHFAEKTALDDCKTELTSLSNAVQARFKTWTATEIEMGDIFKKIFANLSTTSVDIAENKHKCEVLVKTCEGINASIVMMKEEWTKKMIKLVQDLAEQINKTVAEKMPAVDVHKVANVVKDMIKVDLANISVDATNASLKYNNIDAQVKLLEKKIETVGLMIKKYGLKE